MLTNSTIQSIKQAQLSSVVSYFVADLKKKGINYQSCCPFHDEKTPSFSVNDVKNIYKCFGCGAGGNSAISFVMNLKNKTFYEACLTVAEITGIKIEHEDNNFSEEQKKVYAAKQDATQQQEQVLNYVVPVYQKMLHNLPEDHPAKVWLKERFINDEIIAEKQIGWAGSEWNTVTSNIINKNLYEASAALGITKRSINNESNYDGYRSRITFPIKDKNGRYIGLGGRYIKINANDGNNISKYINPTECEIYNKSTVLYGISDAEKAIQQKGYVYLTEGYMDVVSPHRVNIFNTVATCGTALTKDQILLIKRYTNHIALWRDNDSAGEISFAKNLLELLKYGFKVSKVLYKEKDPDEWVKALPRNNDIQCIDEPKLTDAVVYYTTKLWEDAKDDIHSAATAKVLIMELLASIDNEFIRSNYFDSLCKAFKWKTGDTKKELSSILDTTSSYEDENGDESVIKFFPWMDESQKEEALMNGYTSFNRKERGKPMVGYYSFNQNGKTEITNFIVTPLFHVYAGVESRFLLQIYNGYRYAVLDVPAKVIPSIDQFQGFAVSEGNFLIFGAKPQWLRIASNLLQSFPRCIEIQSLGWQSYGFFAYVDKIFIPGEGLKDLNNWGIITHSKENYLIPASCEAYKQLQRTGDDPYENDRYLTYKTSKMDLTFNLWAKQMTRVYDQKGTVGVAYAILTVFRDIIFDVDNNCPHLYAFGEPSSGKSKWAESITALFYQKRSAFNLNSGTDFAFFNYMQRYKNCPAHLNEFEIEVIKPEWFQAIKGIYDGEGRERGKGGSKNRTEVMRVHSTLILTGQKLVTADDNSVVSRSLIEPFSNADFTEDDKQEYSKLKQWEADGLSSILPELIQHRSEFEKEYKEKFNTQLSTWRKTKQDVQQVNQRIMQNFAHLCTCYNVISNYINLPQSAAEFTEYCYKQSLKWSHFIRSTDTLSEFWRTLEFFVSQNEVEYGWDYIVENVFSVRIRINRTEEKTIDFNKPTKVLYIRLNNVHKMFQTAYRSRTGKEAMTLDNLLHYFSSRKYNLGSIKQKQFSRIVVSNEHINNSIQTIKKEEKKITSCYAFIYEDLGIDIENFDGNQPDIKNSNEIPFQ